MYLRTNKTIAVYCTRIYTHTHIIGLFTQRFFSIPLLTFFPITLYGYIVVILFFFCYLNNCSTLLLLSCVILTDRLHGHTYDRNAMVSQYTRRAIVYYAIISSPKRAHTYVLCVCVCVFIYTIRVRTRALGRSSPGERDLRYGPSGRSPNRSIRVVYIMYINRRRKVPSTKFVFRTMFRPHCQTFPRLQYHLYKIPAAM